MINGIIAFVREFVLHSPHIHGNLLEPNAKYYTLLIMGLAQARKELRELSDSERAKNLSRFFKTGAGEYGEGDRFLGITVPKIRQVAKRHKEIDIDGMMGLLSSPYHEERMTALIIMTLRYPRDKDTFYRLYIDNTEYINNWDLVDVTCPKIVGDYLLDKPRDLLYEFADSKDLWKRRIAIISTSTFIRNGQYADTLKLSEILLGDAHDLIHKAVGWMLREVGNHAKETEIEFLKKHYHAMPRTMLRYAIEKFPEEERKKFLRGEF